MANACRRGDGDANSAFAIARVFLQPKALLGHQAASSSPGRAERNLDFGRSTAHPEWTDLARLGGEVGSRDQHQTGFSDARPGFHIHLRSCHRRFGRFVLVCTNFGSGGPVAHLGLRATSLSASTGRTRHDAAPSIRGHGKPWQQPYGGCSSLCAWRYRPVCCVWLSGRYALTSCGGPASAASVWLLRSWSSLSNLCTRSLPASASNKSRFLTMRSL